MKKFNQSAKGFTLVEIMIVVVIIGLLAAMAIPAFQKVRRQSFAKAMANDARQIGAAAQQILMAAPPTLFPGAAIPILYDDDTGTLQCGVADPASTLAAPLNDYLTELVAQIGKGYVVTAYNGNAETAFTITHPRVAPIEVAGPSSTINADPTAGAAVAFNGEGKAR